MVEDGAFNHKIYYFTTCKKILNLEGHPNRITGSKVTAILLDGWILPIGGAPAGKVLRLQPAQHCRHSKRLNNHNQQLCKKNWTGVNLVQQTYSVLS